MARETTIEVDIQINKVYSEKVKKAEERLKKLNKVASKMKVSGKPLSEMEKYQQSIDKTNRLLKKLEKQQGSIIKLSWIQTALKTNVKVTMKDSRYFENEGNKTKTFLDNSGIMKLIYTVLIKLEECQGAMINSHLIMRNIEGYLISACNFLKIANHNNLLWNVLNNIVLNQISNTLATANKEIASLRGELANVTRAEKNITTAESEKNGGDELISDGLNILGTIGVFSEVGGVVGAVAKVAGPVGAILTTAYTAGKYLDKFTDYLGEKITGEQVTKTRYPDGLRILFPYLSGISRVAETKNVKTGEITKYHINGVKKEIYNPETGIKKTYGWFGKLKSEEKISDMPDFSIMANKSTENLRTIAEVLDKNIGINANNQLSPMTRAGIIASQTDTNGNTAFTSGTNLPLNIQEGGIEEKLALIQASSIENMNSLTSLWETYIQKVSKVYDMILLMINMKHVLMAVNTLLTILNIYLAWTSLPPMIETIWQQILGGTDIFLSNLKSKFSTAIEEIKQKVSEIPTNITMAMLPSSGAPGKRYTGTNFWKGGLTYVGERGRELIQYPTGERFVAEAKMLMNLPKGTKIFRNSVTEKMMSGNTSGNKAMTADENNQLMKLISFNGLSDYADFKFSGGTNYSNVQTDNITINITNSFGNQSPSQIKDTNADLVRKINEILFQKEDRKRRVSIG